MVRAHGGSVVEHTVAQWLESTVAQWYLESAVAQWLEHAVRMSNKMNSQYYIYIHTSSSALAVG